MRATRNKFHDSIFVLTSQTLHAVRTSWQSYLKRIKSHCSECEQHLGKGRGGGEGGKAPANQVASNGPAKGVVNGLFPDRLVNASSVLMGWRIPSYQCYSNLRHGIY